MADFFDVIVQALQNFLPVAEDDHAISAVAARSPQEIILMTSLAAAMARTMTPAELVNQRSCLSVGISPD